MLFLSIHVNLNKIAIWPSVLLIYWFLVLVLNGWVPPGGGFGQCQFGCEILKMVGPKMQDFLTRINLPKGNCFKTILQLNMVRNCTFKVNFLSQKYF